MRLWRKLFGIKQSAKSALAKDDLVQSTGASSSGSRTVYQAAGDGDLERVKEALKIEPDLLLRKDWNGYTLLVWAAMYGQVEVAKFLLAGKTESDARDFGIDAALGCAGSKAMAELMLSHHAAVNPMAKGILTPLHHAVIMRLDDVVELLLSKQAEVNARNQSGCTPLHFAAYYSCFTAVKLLLAAKADINVKNDNLRTPLHEAIYYSNQEMVELLLAHGAQVNAPDAAGLTPSHWAAFEGKMDVTKSLLAHHAAINAKTKSSVKPKYFSDVEDEYLPDFVPKANDGMTPLYLAVQMGFTDVAELLRQNGGQE
jgi:ankyrin repeat protein